MCSDQSVTELSRVPGGYSFTNVSEDHWKKDAIITQLQKTFPVLEVS